MIKSPEDILKIMSFIEYDDFTNEEDYIVKTPYKLLKSRKGVCYDQVELEKILFDKISFEYKTFFAYCGDVTDNPTHTFLVFKDKGKYFWFENSWNSYRGIHGPFGSYKEAINYTSKKLEKDWNKRVFLKEYKTFNYKGMNLNDFSKYIVEDK